MKYSNIFFDLDHTIWDFETNAKESLEDVYVNYSLLKKYNIDFDGFYKRYLHHNDILWDKYHYGLIKADELKWKRMYLTLLDYKIANEVLSKEMSTLFLEVLPTKQNLFEYTHEILSYLKNKNYQLHLITNGFEKTQWLKLANSKLDVYFTEVITSEASNSLKPHKEIFEYAIEKTNASFDKSIMIGDNLDADIKGSLNVGMDCIFVNHLNTIHTAKPTYEVKHLKEIETIL